MQKTYKDSRELFLCRIRVNKKDSSFVYFTLEANEGICMYSTEENSLGENYRDLFIQGTIEYKDQFFGILEQLNKDFPIEILENKTVVDT